MDVDALILMAQRSLDKRNTIAVLYSGGLDSTVLLGRLLARGHRVQPLYVRSGLVWEAAELSAARRIVRLLRQERRSRLSRVHVLNLPVHDLYGDHWSITGQGVPDDHTEDAAVYLPGRNPLLLLKACLWCITRGIRQVALGTLARNPFPDATQRFFQSFEQMLWEATAANVQIVRPFASLAKEDLLVLGRKLPLQHTFSCLAPVAGAHCGKCNKCAERDQALATLRPATAAPCSLPDL